MRNLKKFLALVLAMMMVCSLMVTANASDFADEGQINDDYLEAVEVLSAIEVLKGMGDGTFAPKGSFTRAQYAGLMYRIMTGDVTDSNPVLTYMKSVDNDVFTDVRGKADWAVGYINFMASAGLLSGNGDGTFAPNDPISYVGVLAGMLRLIGEGEGTTGTGWEMNSLMKANSLGLTEGVTIGSGAATREMIAQLALNTLVYTDVTENIYTVYIDDDGSKSYTDGDTVLYQGTDYDLAMLYAQSNNAMVDQVRSTVGSLADKNFNGLHEEATPGRDAFKRLTTIWADNDGEVIEVAWPADFYYDGTLTGADAKALGAKTKELGDIDYTIYYNGSEPANAAALDFVAEGTDGKVGMWVSDSAGKPGYEVYIYRLGTGVVGGVTVPHYEIIVREAYVAMIDEIDEDTNDIALTVYERGYVASNPGTGMEFTVKAASATVEADDIYASLAGYEEGDVIAIYAAQGFENYNPAASDETASADTYLLEVAPLTEQEITIRQINDNGWNINSTIITTAGATHKINNETMCVDGTTSDVIPTRWAQGTNLAYRTIDVGTATIYTMANGNVLFYDQYTAPASTSGYAYVWDYKGAIGTDPTTNWESEGGGKGPGTTGMWVRMITTDKEQIEGRVQNAGDFTDPDGLDLLGKLVYYSRGSNGRYTLQVIGEVNATNTAKLEVTNKKSEFNIPSSAATTYTVAADSSTVFLVVQTAVDEYGIKHWLADYQFYDIYDVPNLTASAGTVAAARTITEGRAVTADGQVVKFVVVVDAGTVSTSGYYFILGQANATKVRVLRTSNTDYYEYIEYKAVVDGELGSVKVKVYDTEYSDAENAALTYNVLGNTVSFTKNVVLDADDGCVIDYGVDVSTGTDDTNVINDATAVSKVTRDHIKITTANGQEDYLVSSALSSVAFEYDVAKGILKAVALDKIKATTGTHYAVRNTQHTVVSALFIDIGE